MRKLAVGMIGATATALIGLGGGTAWAQADKIGVAASTTDFLFCDGSNVPGGDSAIACEDMLNNDGASGGILDTASVLPFTRKILGPVPSKFSTEGDAVIDVNLECMLFNEVKSTHGDTNTEVSTSSAGLLVFAVIDDDDDFDEGVETGMDPVAVGVTNSLTTFDSGQALPGVRFCSRLVDLEFSGGGEEVDDAFVRALIASESTHGFKWVAEDPVRHFSENDLFVFLVGVIDEGPSGGGKKGGDQVSGVGFGERLMTVESVKLPNSSQF